jgi:Tol biopolymer transport system component
VDRWALAWGVLLERGHWMLAGAWVAMLGEACVVFGYDVRDYTHESTVDADAGAGDAGTTPAEAAPAPCGPDAPFGPIQPILGLESTSAFGPRLGADELTVYFQSWRPDTLVDNFVASRGSTNEPFGAAAPLDALNSTSDDGNAMVSSNGLVLLFTSARPGGAGGYDLYLASRALPTDAFGGVTRLDAVSSVKNESEPYLSFDGQELWYTSTISGNSDVYRAQKKDASFVNPVPVSELNSAADEAFPVVSADGLTVYFGTNRRGTHDIFSAHRAERSAAFPPPQPVEELNGTGDVSPGWISPDGCRLYLSRTTNQVYKAAKTR